MAKVDAGTIHRFTMIQRAIRGLAKGGAFDQVSRLFRELLDISPDDAQYSLLKVRFAAEVSREAIKRERRDVASEILDLTVRTVDREHLTPDERKLLDEAQNALISL